MHIQNFKVRNPLSKTEVCQRNKITACFLLNEHSELYVLCVFFFFFFGGGGGVCACQHFHVQLYVCQTEFVWFRDDCSYSF